MTRASIGLIPSKNNTDKPAFLDTLLYTLVAPMFCEPVLVISFPVRNLVTIFPKGIDPNK